jgi:UTP--glucose-1-phosphate uridylyltransferase
VKGVILAAGYGSRFLPITKSIPKEMLPLITKPAIEFIIEEFIASGIEDILIVTSRRKKSLEDYLDREVELETVFTREKSQGKLERVKPHDARFFFTRQQRMMGTGHALLLTQPFVGDDPFVVAYPDDLHFGSNPLTAQLIEKHRETGCSILATIYDPPALNRYGVVTLAEDGVHITDIVEKPAVGQEPSREASIGRFLYTSEIFPYLEEGARKHSEGEYYHTGALKKLAGEGRVAFHRFEGTRYDVGDPEGYFRAILRFAQQVPELKKILQAEGRSSAASDE